MAKKLYQGGFRLTLKTARALAVQEFGTCKGLQQGNWHNSEGFYEMTMGNLEIEIHDYYIKDSLRAEMDKL